MTVSYKDFPYPLEGYEFPQNIVLYADEDPFREAALKVGTKIVDKVDDMLVKAIIEHAEKEGFSHVYLLDKTFVTNALLHELERWEEDNKDV